MAPTDMPPNECEGAIPYCYESVSTVAIIKKARKEGIELLQIDQENLEEALLKLHNDSKTIEDVKTAVQSGKLVTAPVEDI